MVSNVAAAAAGGAFCCAKAAAEKISHNIAAMNLHMASLCSTARPAVNGKKMSAALGARLTLPENGKGSVASGTLLPSTWIAHKGLRSA